jgi:carbon monoxide dehydrogenase subunit G
MKTVQCTTKIDRPSHEVFSILTDQACDERWMFGVTGTDRITPGDMRKETQMICKFGVGPITTMSANAIIDEFEPGRRFVRRRVGGLMAMRGEFAVEPNGNSTRMIWTMDVGLNVPFVGFLFSPLLAQWMKMSMTISLRNLKTLAEAEPQRQIMPEKQYVSYHS